MSIVDEIAAERRRQIEVEGWTPEHDDTHKFGEIGKAAACYAMGDYAARGAHSWISVWPWARHWWKPKDRRRDLIRAAALIVAEIERLDRKASEPDDAPTDRASMEPWPYTGAAPGRAGE